MGVTAQDIPLIYTRGLWLHVDGAVTPSFSPQRYDLRRRVSPKQYLVDCQKRKQLKCWVPRLALHKRNRPNKFSIFCYVSPTHI